jgi:hypothetical protein
MTGEIFLAACACRSIVHSVHKCRRSIVETIYKNPLFLRAVLLNLLARHSQKRFPNGKNCQLSQIHARRGPWSNRSFLMKDETSIVYRFFRVLATRRWLNVASCQVTACLQLRGTILNKQEIDQSTSLNKLLKTNGEKDLEVCGLIWKLSIKPCGASSQEGCD